MHILRNPFLSHLYILNIQGLAKQLTVPEISFNVSHYLNDTLVVTYVGYQTYFCLFQIH